MADKPQEKPSTEKSLEIQPQGPYRRSTHVRGSRWLMRADTHPRIDVELVFGSREEEGIKPSDNVKPTLIQV